MKCTLCFIVLCSAVARASLTSPVDDRLLGSQLTLQDEYVAEKEMTKFQLPSDVEPVRYELHVNPQMDKAAFEGLVKISVKALASTNRIYLNAKYIQLANGSEPVRVTRINVRRSEKLPVHNVTFDVPNEQMVINLNKALSAKSSYLVEIDYTGTLGDDMMGFYLSRYATSAGKQKVLASTQFEPTGARRAFPCFDEPKYKTRFTIKITRDKTQKSISNLPLDITEAAPNSTTKETDTFQISPPMPTYLVGFAVFEFESISNKNGTFRVWGREDVIKKQGQYIFDKGQKILDALSKYMGIDYYSLLPKMDLVAVPDFDAGAMENWGMNTYREKFVLLSSSHSTTYDYQRATSVVTHEFTHQWFGDLVTPARWDFTWLNEAFARNFEYFGTALVEPTWRMEDLFVVEQVQVAFNADLKGSHAMTSKTTTPQSIADTFDHIIYNKGGSVLRMIENAVTPEIFKQSLQLYLKNGATEELGGTVEPSNLWDAFDDVILAANATKVLPPGTSTITDFVDEWTNKPGFPLVTITRNYTNNIATVTQQRFFLKKADMDADQSQWTIPITYTTKTGGSSGGNLVWFLKTQESLSINLTDSNDWLIANVKEVGFYRVNYDAANWALLVAQLKSDPSKIHVLNRAQILDDAFSLARAGQLKLETALELTHYLQKETDFIPWYSVYSHVKYLLGLYADTELGNQMKTYFTDRMDGIFKVLGLEDKPTEENMNKLGRSSIASWICQLGHSGCTSEAAQKFRVWIQDPEKSNIAPNIKDAVYCTGIRHGTKDQWTNLWKYYLKTDLASEKVAVLYALGCSTDENTLYSLLSKIKDKGTEVRAQDHYILIRAVIGERPGVKAALRFLKTDGAALLKEAKENELSPVQDNLRSIVANLGASVRNQEELTELTNILEPIRTDATIASSINKTLEHVAERFQFKTTQQAVLNTWFAAHTPTTTTPPPTSTPSTRATTSQQSSDATTSPTPPPAPTTPKPNSATLSQISKWFLLTSLMVYALC